MHNLTHLPHPRVKFKIDAKEWRKKQDKIEKR